MRQHIEVSGPGKTIMVFCVAIGAAGTLLTGKPLPVVLAAFDRPLFYVSLSQGRSTMEKSRYFASVNIVDSRGQDYLCLSDCRYVECIRRPARAYQYGQRRSLHSPRLLSP